MGLAPQLIRSSLHTKMLENDEASWCDVLEWYAHAWVEFSTRAKNNIWNDENMASSSSKQSKPKVFWKRK